LLLKDVQGLRQYLCNRNDIAFFGRALGYPEFLPQHRGALLAVIEAATSLQDALDAIVRVEH
jgi:hypothetical protein